MLICRGAHAFTYALQLRYLLIFQVYLKLKPRLSLPLDNLASQMCAEEPAPKHFAGEQALSRLCPPLASSVVITAMAPHLFRKHLG